jgi:hypothetical protein
MNTVLLKVRSRPNYGSTDCMTGTASIAAFLTFTETRGMSLCGRFSPLLVLYVESTQGSANGRYLSRTSRLANNYLIIS